MNNRLAAVWLMVWLMIGLPAVAHGQPAVKFLSGLNQANNVEKAIRADYLVCTRVIGTGDARCSYVRYLVRPDRVQFVVLWSEPEFTVSLYPGVAQSFMGDWDRAADTCGIYEKLSGFAYSKTDGNTVRPFAFGNFNYSQALLAETPRGFKHWEHALPGQFVVEQGRRRYPKSRLGQDHVATFLEDRVVSTSWRSTKGAPPFTSAYEYQDGLLKRLNASLPAHEYSIPADKYFKSQLREAGVTSNIRHVKVSHRNGGRQVVVDYETNPKIKNSLPKSIAVSSQSPTARIENIQSAILIDWALTDEIWPPLNEEHLEELKFMTRRLRSRFSTYWSERFASPEAKQLLAELQRLAETESAPDTRIAANSMLVTAAILSWDHSSIRELTQAYLNTASTNGMRAYLPEIAMELIKRAAWSGDQQIFDTVVDVAAEEMAKLSWSEKLDGLLNCRASTVTAFALLRLSLGGDITKPLDFSAIESPTDRLRCCVLIASLMPSIKAERAGLKDKAFQRFDRVASQLAPAGRLRQLQASAATEAQKTFQAMSQDQQEIWRAELMKIQSWSAQ
ncbi:MAG: hypothetical protein NXI04_16050 [Planctomycetaceae bacterium]|nr:hypothetical protein [Planctomycetaceae bacterium]